MHFHFIKFEELQLSIIKLGCQAKCVLKSTKLLNICIIHCIIFLKSTDSALFMANLVVNGKKIEFNPGCGQNGFQIFVPQSDVKHFNSWHIIKVNE